MKFPFMTRLPDFRYIYFTGILCVLSVIFTCNTTLAYPGKKIPVLVAGISITARPVMGARGDIIGATIPLRRAGRLFLVEGTNDNIIGNFILDTGASTLVLNKTYFRSSMKFTDEEGGGVTGPTPAVERTVIKSLVISDLAYSNITADVVPLGHLENRRGVKILGLFGMSLLDNVEMVIDVRHNELQVFKLDRIGMRIGTPSPVVKYDLVQKMEVFHHVMFVKAVIGGKLLTFCLDTGAESNVISIDANKKVLSAITNTQRSGLSGAGQNRGDVLYGELNEFTMGGRQMAPMGTIVCNLSSMSQQYEYPIDGILGYDFFAKGKIYINLVKKELGISLYQGEKK